MTMRHLLSLAAFLFTLGLAAQEVPQAAVDAFHQRFPDVTTVEWTEVNGLHRATFHLDGVHRSVDLDSQGQLIGKGLVRTEQDLTKAERASLTDAYPGFRVTSVRSVQTAARGTFTEVMLTDGRKTVEVLLDGQGRVSAANERK